MRALEIGPGRNPVDKSWTIIDMVKRPWVDIVHDVRKLPLPFKDNSFDLVYLSHILEHIPWFQTLDFLKEIRRILVQTGTIEVWVPDFKKLVECYLKRKSGDNWRRYNPNNDPMMWLNGRIFTYGPGEENWHRTVFDCRYLKDCLKAAGFQYTDDLKKPRGYDHGFINLGVAAVK